VAFPRITVPPSFDRFDERFEQLWKPLRRSPVLDRVFYTASEIGDFGMVWLAIAAVQAAVGPAPKTRVALRLAAALGIESILVNGGVKSLFRRERPTWEQERPIHLRQPRTSSFPSGHSSSAVTAAILLSDTSSVAALPLYWTLAAIVATSRVHVKIHHGSDVVAGLAVGALYGTVVKALLPL
jgi:membrane-associated phospholipid phosphatase